MIIHMLSNSEYEAIGRMALAFNEVEFMIEAYLGQLISSREKSVGSLLATGERFSRKVDLFRKVLNAIITERPSLGSRTAEVIALLDRARLLAMRRNEYVHALVIEDFSKNETRLRVKHRVEKPCNEQEIRELGVQMIQLSLDLDYRLFVFLEDLQNAREND